MAMSKPRFVSSTLLRICDPEPSSYGLDFSNLCVVMNSLPSTAHTYIPLLASSPDDACFCLLVGVVENWIQDMAERFPKTAAGVPNAQLDFKRANELKMCAFIADFMKEYNSTSLPPADVCSITFERLGTFLHLALFHAWSDAICNNKNPLIIPSGLSCWKVCPACRILPFWMNDLQIAAARGCCISCLRLHIHVMRERQRQ